MKQPGRQIFTPAFVLGGLEHAKLTLFRDKGGIGDVRLKKLS